MCRGSRVFWRSLRNLFYINNNFNELVNNIKSIKEIVDEIIEEKNIEKSKTKKIHNIVKMFIGENEEWNKELIEKIISANEDLF